MCDTIAEFVNIKMYSKQIRKSGLFYKKRKTLLANWKNTDDSSQLDVAHVPGIYFIRNIRYMLIYNNFLGHDLHEASSSGKNNEDEHQHNSCDSEVENTSVGDHYTDEEMGCSSADDDDTENADFRTAEFDGMSLPECVRYWALETNQDHRSINMIMRIISSKTSGKLPRDARTLLQTSRQTPQIDSKAGGKFWYNGLRKCLADFFR